MKFICRECRRAYEPGTMTPIEHLLEGYCTLKCQVAKAKSLGWTPEGQKLGITQRIVLQGAKEIGLLPLETSPTTQVPKEVRPAKKREPRVEVKWPTTDDLCGWWLWWQAVTVEHAARGSDFAAWIGEFRAAGLVLTHERLWKGCAEFKAAFPTDPATR